MVEAGAPVALGQAIEADWEGRAVPHGAGVRVGRALSEVSGAGQALSIFLHPH
jgi:hypothetical protein